MPYDFVSSLDVVPAAAVGLVSTTEDVVLLACSDRIDAFDTGAAGWASWKCPGCVHGGGKSLLVELCACLDK